MLLYPCNGRSPSASAPFLIQLTIHHGEAYTGIAQGGGQQGDRKYDHPLLSRAQETQPAPVPTAPARRHKKIASLVGPKRWPIKADPALPKLLSFSTCNPTTRIQRILCEALAERHRT
ncbi:hypothetical protein AC578_6585 [Pseudocercospora eumusae]|uniref:Uncharacterized protein n=1 Tax=Pseudocercospora eumusae TaxID=321146 RepID=A0A139GW19_9PEZI|nr:hypothetical protein AC578_6585 [Pseudocercospora eumusae]